MAYREVTMLEVKEVLRLWLAGVRRKRIAAQLGLNVKTVRRYLRAAHEHGLTPTASAEQLDDDLLAAVVSTVQPGTGRPHGDGWALCAAQRDVIERFLRADVRLFAGKRVYTSTGVKGDANKAVIAALEQAGKLLAAGRIRHSYPHSWRSKAPVIFRNAPQ